MNIYTYYGFDGKQKTSRRLLAAAIDEYNADEGINCELSGKELVKRIQLGENGKPYIPGWSKFSVSHSEDAWAVLISEEECGLDIQYAKDTDFDRVGRRFFAEEDAEAIDEGGKETFFRVWTRREAVAKATGDTVFTAIPSVLDNFVEMNGVNWFVQDVELLDSDEGMYSAMCTKDIPTIVHHYRLHL